MKAILGFLPVLFAVACVGTTIAQGVGVAMLVSRGSLTADKLNRYAAILYGLDPAELAPREEPADESAGANDGPDLIAARVKSSKLLTIRQNAIGQGTRDVQLRFQQLELQGERFEERKAVYSDYLVSLEKQARDSAIQEVRRTFEVLKPKQTKDILVNMFKNQGLDSTDDVLADVVILLKGMQKTSLKRILNEFKSPEEEQMLNEILLSMANLDGS